MTNDHETGRESSRRRFLKDGLHCLSAGGVFVIAPPRLLGAPNDTAAEVTRENRKYSQSGVTGSRPGRTADRAPKTSIAAVNFDLVASYNIPEAGQAVAVDDAYFYAIDNRTIAKYCKVSGKRIGLWRGAKDGPLNHLNSAAVVNERLYLAHSNYPEWPPASSIEIFDTESLTHIGSHSFGVDIGSLTWVDLAPDGRWFGGFASYNGLSDDVKTQGRDNRLTQIVEFDDRWQIVQRWTLPAALIKQFGAMSNSGGSWGADNRLYLTGHDKAETYIMRLPNAGPVLDWVDTAALANTGQGIAWDRTRPGELYAVARSRNPTGINKVTVNRMRAAVK